MGIELDHAIVAVRDRRAAASLLAFLLDVPWEPAGTGRFTPVFINDGLTLDFDDAEADLPVQHFCFRVNEHDFDTIQERIVEQGIAYRSTPHGPVDMKVNTRNGGKNLYWEAPAGLVWEILTVSYARQS